MTDIELDAGTLEFSEADGMTATGLLIPFDEEGRSNLGRFSVGPDSFTIPDDLAGMSLNVEHAREDVVGAMTAASKTDRGIVATFSFADTDEGRAAYADAKSGKRKHLSAEVAGVVIRQGRAVAGRLFAGALVRRPAFPSATLLAAAVDTEPDTLVAADPLTPDANGDIAIDATDTPATVTVTAGTTTTVYDPQTTQPNGDAVTTATVPETLQAAAPAGKKPLTKTQVFNILHAIQLGQADETMLASLTENSGPAAATMFAALNDVKYDGAGGLTTGIQLLQWVGEVWDGTTYEQKYAPLFGHKDLTGLQLKGYKWGVKPQGGTWAGNKAAVNSNAPTMVPVTADALRYSMGHDLAREFRDLQAFGDRSFFDAYYAAGADDYKQWVDETVVLAQVLAAATSSVADNPAGLDIGAGLSAIIDGAANVIAAKANPSFALVETSLWKSIVKTGKNEVLGYLGAALNLKDGQLDGFRLIPSDDLAAGNVLVGAREAVDVYELPGAAPIRVEAPDMVKGGIDTGLFGYAGVLVNKATALQLVTPYAGA